MAYTVYAIRSKEDDRIYVGFTQDVQKRLLEHNRGETKSTKGYRPWVLVYTEEVDSREEARNLEKYYKSGSGKEKLKRFLAL